VTEVRDLKPNGQNLRVTEENKKEYVKLVCQMKMTGAIQKQLQSFLEGFYSIIPKRLISIFNEQELELLISGLPTFDIDDLRANTEYHKYQATSLQVHSCLNYTRCRMKREIQLAVQYEKTGLLVRCLYIHEHMTTFGPQKFASQVMWMDRWTAVLNIPL